MSIVFLKKADADIATPAAGKTTLYVDTADGAAKLKSEAGAVSALATSGALTAHTTDTANPHAVTKAQVGLTSAEDKSSATIRGEITSGNVTTALGFTPGTVNSVALATSGVIHSVSGSPVTGAGTLTLGLISQVANTIFAGPVSGANAAPSFRTIADVDIQAGLGYSPLGLLNNPPSFL